MSTPNNPSPAPTLQFPFMSGQQFGQAGPGPSTMAQNRPSLHPHQLQLLHQVTAAARAQGMNLSPQQLSAVVGQMQSQGNSGNPQALSNALRALSGQNQGGPGQQGGMQGMQGMPGMGGDQQQQQQQPGQSGQQPSQHTMQQQQQLQQMMQSQQSNPMGNMGLQQSQQQFPGQPGRSGTPSNNNTNNDAARQSMPPPGSVPNASPRNGGPQMQGVPNQPQQQQQQRFMPNQQQQAMLAHQQQLMLTNPQFQTLPPQQQQQHLVGLHQKMMNAFISQSASQQQQSQQQQPGQGQGQGQGQDGGHNFQQQPPSHQPPTPQNGPPSSLPPHMAPPRPGSAASHHPSSPHHQGSPMASHTPPPMSNQYMPNQSNNGGSPAPSPQSQIQPHPQHLPAHSASPLSAQHTGTSSHQPTPVDVNGQMGQAGNIRPPQPPPVFPPGANGMTSQQQQQMAAAMNIFGQAAQAQNGGSQPVRPPQSSMNTGMNMGRPPVMPMPGVNPNEFPFDYRLMPMMRFAADPRWLLDMRSKNPQLAQAVQNAQNMISQGIVRPEMIQRMNQFYFTMSQNQNQVRPPPPPPPGQGPGPNNGPGGIPPQMQHQFMAGQQGGQPGTPDRRDSNGPLTRPPPSHVAPETPTGQHDHRLSSGGTRGPNDLTKTGTPVVANMPPPAWIPGQPTPTRQAPPESPRTAQPGSSTALTHALPVKEWEGSLRMDLPITSINPLPEDGDDPTFGGQLPVMTEKEKEEVADWIEADKQYAAGMPARGKDLQKKMFKWARNNDMDTPWWSVRKGERYHPPRQRLQILFPQDKDIQRMRRSHKNNRHIKYTPAQFKAMAQVEDHVIPVRLDIEHEHTRFKDTFMWNVSDTVITPEVFAASLCGDYGLSTSAFSAKIAAAIHERIAEYRDQVAPAEQPGPSLRGKLDEEGDDDSKALVETFRRIREIDDDENETDSSPISDEIRTDPGADNDDQVKVVTFEDTEIDMDEKRQRQERPMSVEELSASLEGGEYGEDLRLLIKIDIMVGNQNLSDTFEWDINSEVTPEEFAASYCRELGLSGEFITALSHDIHEQIMVQRRCLFLTGHIYGSGLELDDEVKTSFLPPLRNVVRTEQVAMSSFTPIFATFTGEDIAAIEKERDRDSKRKRRATRARRGVILPDREPPKTHRTLLNMVGPNGALAHATETSAPVPVQSSRRAAAIAAQANINLLAQDLPIPQPPTPPPNPIPARMGKARGRAPGVGRGNYPRGSPASFDLNGDNTPSLPSSALKRSFREDSASEMNSPSAKASRLRNGMSPATTEDQQVKFEPGTFTHIPSGLNDTKRKSEDMHEARDSKAPKIDLVPTNQIQQVPTNGPPTMSTQSMPMSHTQSVPSSPSDSGSDSSDSDYGAPKKPAAPPVNQKSVTPAPRTVSTGAGGKAISPVSYMKQEAPSWVVRAHADLVSKYPNDDFVVVPRPKPADQPDAIQEWRMKCHDCPGRIYSLGPGETLSNFEVHLKNRGHMANVQARLDKK